MKFIKISLVIILLFIGLFIFSIWYKKNRSYDEIYATTTDKALAQVIENSINPDFKKLNLDLELDDIDYVCYSKSIYGPKANEMLDNLGIKNKYTSLIEEKKLVGYGEGSSLFMFIKNNGDVIPVFVSAYFYDLKTDYTFQNGCTKTKNNKLNIKINSALKEKALINLN